MSLYNMLFGQNPAADLLLAMLNLNQGDVGRYRDCYPSEDGTKILVYTRNGGGNREQYQGVLDALKDHPNWLNDQDDDFDCTYATIEFSVPAGCEEAVKRIADQTDTRTGAAKWDWMLEALQSNKDNAATARAMEVGKQIFGKIAAHESGMVSTPEGSVQIMASEPKQ